ncbi:MAG: GntR family transcriptional regulator [Victivallales bacterium]|nr:GntR family transcriptional regulator [Victivallales bacterium]
MRKSKAFKLEAILSERIRLGDYAFVRFPSERKLAEAFGVTQMTARKAVLNLESQGLLKRQANGTLSADAVGIGKKGRIAILMPTYPSNYHFMCHEIVMQTAETNGWQCRTSLYMHWDDAILEETLKNFDGVFIVAVSEKMPERIAMMIRKAETPLICLGGDLSGHGIPSLTMTSNNLVPMLVEHLMSQGHKQIDFFNAQPEANTVLRNIKDWRAMLRKSKLSGKLFNVVVESYGNSYLMALEFIKTQLSSGTFNSKCLLCNSIAEAIGACRALADHGLMAGRDVAIASIGGNDMAKLYIPSITYATATNYSSGVKRCLEWMSGSSCLWNDGLLIWADNSKIFTGESSMSYKPHSKTC